MSADRPSRTACSQPETFLEVAVALPVVDTRTYRSNRPGEPIPVGSQVLVPLRNRTVTGFVVGHVQNVDAELRANLRDIVEVVGEGPAIDAPILELCRWAAGYYLAPLGEVLISALPSGERASSAT